MEEWTRDASRRIPTSMEIQVVGMSYVVLDGNVKGSHSKCGVTTACRVKCNVLYDKLNLCDDDGTRSIYCNNKLTNHSPAHSISDESSKGTFPFVPLGAKGKTAI